METFYNIYLVFSAIRLSEFIGIQLLTISATYYFYYCSNIKQRKIVIPLQNPIHYSTEKIIKLFMPGEIHIGNRYNTSDCYPIKNVDPKLNDIYSIACGIISTSLALTQNIKSLENIISGKLACLAHTCILPIAFRLQYV